jgi:hypothetical protein
MMKIRQFCW